MNVTKQMKEILHYFRCNQIELAEKLGLDYWRIHNLSVGKVKKFNSNELLTLENSGFNKIWLLTGSGIMLENEVNAEIEDIHHWIDIISADRDFRIIIEMRKRFPEFDKWLKSRERS